MRKIFTIQDGRDGKTLKKSNIVLTIHNDKRHPLTSMYEFYLFMQFNIDVYDLFNLIVTKNSGERNLAWRKSRGTHPK